jgi:hypothetical protein
MQQSKKIFDFNKQMKIGNNGEDFFCECYKDRSPIKSSFREFDVIIDGNKMVEIKTDSYSMDSTPNFFMERYGDKERTKEAGPWRAKKDSLNYFCYLFIKDKTFFWFYPQELCDFLDNHINELEEKEIRNKGWSAIGFCVEREKIKHLALQIDKF